jgi:uncharacterized protein (UPF0332 family)
MGLNIHSNTPHKTSKHSGVIGIFNKEFVHTGKLDARFAKMLYDLFDERMELDYREFAEVSEEDAWNAVSSAQEWLNMAQSDYLFSEASCWNLTYFIHRSVLNIRLTTRK